MPQSFMDQWHHLLGVLGGEKAFAFFFGLIIGYIIRAIKV